MTRRTFYLVFGWAMMAASVAMIVTHLHVAPYRIVSWMLSAGIGAVVAVRAARMRTTP